MKKIIASICLFFPLALTLFGCSHRVAETSPEARDTLTNSVGMKFVLIQPGSFTMGYPAAANVASLGLGPRKVTIDKPFYLQTTEVTQGQWQQVMGYNPAYFRDCGDDCPVEQITWSEAREFIGRLNKMEKTEKYRFPEESEWEYGCWAGSRADSASAAGTTEEGDSKEVQKTTSPVAKNQPNGLGLYDMQSNVWEWCQNPRGPSAGSVRLLRGGQGPCYNRMQISVGTSSRGGRGMRGRAGEIRGGFFGFRVARDF